MEIAKKSADIVIINDVNENDAQNTVNEIKVLGKESSYYITDVSNHAEVEKMIDQIVKDFGRLDILVNNAGITRDTLLMRMKEEDWDKVLNINLKSAFNTIKTASKYMMKQRTGKIVNIASVIGLIGNIGQANYSASKAGLIGLTKTTARELATRGINVNAVAPGFIQTEMTDKLSEDIKTKLKAQVPMGILGTPKDVANAVTFLVSDKASYITGQVLTVDGGMVMS